MAMLRRAGEFGAIRPAWQHFYMFMGAYLGGDLKEAAYQAGQITADNYSSTHLARALIAVAAGDTERARQAVDRLTQVQPGWRDRAAPGTRQDLAEPAGRRPAGARPGQGRAGWALIACRARCRSLFHPRNFWLCIQFAASCFANRPRSIRTAPSLFAVTSPMSEMAMTSSGTAAADADGHEEFHDSRGALPVEQILSIENVAETFGISRWLLRFCEFRGLIKRRNRIGTTWVYSWADCDRIAFIIKCRQRRAALFRDRAGCPGGRRRLGSCSRVGPGIVHGAGPEARGAAQSNRRGAVGARPHPVAAVAPSCGDTSRWQAGL